MVFSNLKLKNWEMSNLDLGTMAEISSSATPELFPDDLSSTHKTCLLRLWWRAFQSLSVSHPGAQLLRSIRESSVPFLTALSPVTADLSRRHRLNLGIIPIYLFPQISLEYEWNYPGFLQLLPRQAIRSQKKDISQAWSSFIFSIYVILRWFATCDTAFFLPP